MAGLIVMAGPDRPSLPLDHHFRLYLTAQRSFSSVKPSFLPIIVGSAVIFFRQTIILGHFCWLDGHFLPPSHHFCPFLTALRLFLSAKPSFSAIIAGSTVIFVRQAIIFAHYCRLGGHFLPPGHQLTPFLLARQSSWPT